MTKFSFFKHKITQNLLFLSDIRLMNWAVKKQAAENKANLPMKKKQKLNKP